MLPSDHFVKFYNEVFKMLENINHEALQKYWKFVSSIQDEHIGPLIKRKGFNGMYEYWERIKKEENCDLDMQITSDYFELKMNKCPSLSKVQDNDAGQFEYYCDHCAGWIEPIMNKYGYYLVYDIISRNEPKCMMRVYKDKSKALEFAKTAKLLAKPY